MDSAKQTFQVRVLADWSQVAALQLDWERLYERTPEASFFQSYAWFAEYWQHCAGNQRLHVMVVEDADRPVGILPLVVRPVQTRAGVLQTLTYPLDAWGASYGPLGEDCRAVLAAALRHLATSPTEWDILELGPLEGEPLFDQTRAALGDAGLSFRVRQVDLSSIVQLCGTWSNFLRVRGPKFGQNLRRTERRLADHGPIEFIRFRPETADCTADPRWDLYDACEHVCQASWQSAAETGVSFVDPRVRAFLRSVHERAVREGACDLCLLRVGGRPAAFAYNYVRAGRVFGLRSGYDANVSSAGLGSFLFARMIEDGFGRGDAELHLGVGYREAKLRWSTHERPVYSLCHYRSGTWRTQAVKLKRLAEDRWQAATAWLADAWGQVAPAPGRV